MHTDEYYMSLALKEAAKGKYHTWKNPMVGAVIVKNNTLLAIGYHHQFGKKHAERDAIDKLTSDQLLNSTLYVTLEPCTHTGKQPPCSNLIITKKIKRVVIGQIDPHQLVNGKGIKQLKESGVIVTSGVLAKKAERLNKFYTYFYQNNLPWITIKQAISLDHKVGVINTRSKITNTAVYQRVHQERANYQAILIGSKTAIIDNPLLHTLVSTPFPPIRIVLDRRGRLLEHLNLKIFQDSTSQTWIFTQNQKLFTKTFPNHVKIFLLNNSKLTDVIQLLAKKGIQSLYIEGGPTIQESFLKTNLVHYLITYISPTFLGFQGLNAFIPQEKTNLTDLKIALLDNNIRIAGKIKNV